MRTQSPTAISPDFGVGTDTTAELATDLARLRELIAEAPITEVRDFVKELERAWPASREVQHFARVLAPPVVLVAPEANHRARDLTPEFEWLREHADAYTGCWLALQGDRLPGANPRLQRLLIEIVDLPESESAFLHFQPPSKDVR